jgi:hypothetical protein
LSRPKGSVNKKTNDLDRLQQKVYELEKSHNSYEEVQKAFAEGYILEMTDNVKTISLDTLQKWFSNPDQYIENISNLLSYHYLCNGDVFQLFDMIFSLPQLDYKITAYEKTKSYTKDVARIRQVLEKTIKHKQLTRDLLVQLAHDGTLIGTWLGSSSDPYFYTFDNLKYIYPYGRFKNDMIGVIDLKWLETMASDEERESIYNNLKPLVSQNKYDKWKNELNAEKKKKLQYITLPPEKTLVARTHTLNRNQRLGLPYGTQTLFDIQHKNKMKDLERAIANKIIRAIMVLKFKGKDDNDVKVKEGLKKEVFNKVKKVLENNAGTQNSISVIGIPDFASIESPEFKNGDKILSPEKYESTNADIANATGVSTVLTSGQGGNYSGAKLNLDILYKKIAVLLEQVEEVYNQLIVQILGEKKGNNYTFSYSKETPLEKTKKLETLMKLQTMGFSTSYILDELGINSEAYFEQSIYEIEELKLRDRIIPQMSVYTMSGKDDDGIDGAPTVENPTNDNTIQSKEIDSGNMPKPSKNRNINLEGDDFDDE